MSKRPDQRQTRPVYGAATQASTHLGVREPWAAVEVLVRLAEGLNALTGATLAEGWKQYDALLVAAREEDNRRLQRIEQVLEHVGDEGQSAQPLPRRLRLVVDDLHIEFEDAWARLTGRTLVENLKVSGLSLRALADRVEVSAPYLSQLTAGAGPVPSERILEKLRRGHLSVGLTVPDHPLSPSQAFNELRQRATAAREHLAIAAVASPRPRVSVEHPANRRVETALRDSFEVIAERYVDTEGPIVRELLELLASADPALLALMASVGKDDDGLANTVRGLSRLQNNVREKVVELINAVAPPPEPMDLVERPAKQKL